MLSKNQQKKLKRDQEWEASRESRKAKRREKIREKKQSKRTAREQVATTDSPDTGAVQVVTQLRESFNRNKRARHQYTQLPITLLLDCGFDELMMDKELKSLTSQITRCYSDNHKAPFQAHLIISSFGGHLKERYDGILAGDYRFWRNVRFLEEDFVKAAEQATELMSGPEGGKLAGVFARDREPDHKPEEPSKPGEVVYLTSDSPYTLTELRPFSTYIIGGLVDKNRHKGICYKTAIEKGIKTAKLPIGEYMKMNSRFVLATNHVVEIMLRWLELGYWGKAFDMVIPKRKGGVLKGKAGEPKEQLDENAPDDCNDAAEDDRGNPQTLPLITATESGDIEANSEQAHGLKEADMQAHNESQDAVNSDEKEAQTAVSSKMVGNRGHGTDAKKGNDFEEADPIASSHRIDTMDEGDEDVQTVFSSTMAENGDSDTPESFVPLTGTKRRGEKRTAEIMNDGTGRGPSKRPRGTAEA